MWLIVHELGLVKRIVDKCIAVAEQNHVTQIAEIILEVGELSLIVPHLLQHAFTIVVKNTVAEHAKLTVVRTPGRLKCEQCQKESEVWFKGDESKDGDPTASIPANQSTDSDWSRNLFQCQHCGSHQTTVIGGKSLLIKSIRVV